MRNTFANVFYEEAKKDSRLCVVVADISPAGSMETLRNEYPDRFINTGVAEQIMIGMCAGMAMRGLRPFAYTIATFALFRPFEFIRDDLCYQGLPVTVVGVGGGVAYSTLGGTHHAMEDIAVANALPNMRIIAPCDPEEVAAATRYCVAQEDGPVYMRLGKAGESVLGGQDSEPFIFGKLRTLRRGDDACIIGYGPIMKLGIEAASILEAKGISVAVVSSHTIKPIDTKGIAAILHRFKQVVILEEMVPVGGLVSQVKSIAWDIGAKCKLESVTLKHEFLHVYGSHEDVLRAHGVTVEQLVRRIS